MRLRRHTNQPPIDRQKRPDESRMLWLGLLVGVIGTALIAGGLLLPTGVLMREGSVASERQLVEAFRHGGVFAGQVTATGPTSRQGVIDPNVQQACPT